MNLTDEQKAVTLNMFNDDPNIINITKKTVMNGIIPL